MTKMLVSRPLTADDIRRLAGDIADHRLLAILDIGGTVEDLEEALAWDSGNGDLGRRLTHNLSGNAARIFEILFEDQRLEEERRS